MPLTVYLLSACQALLMVCNSIIISAAALVGAMFAPSVALATVPVFMQFLAVTVLTFPASLFMARFGRRTGFALGAALGLVGACLSVAAIMLGSFRLFCIAALLFGSYLAFASYYRFAAAEAAPANRRARAISITMLGGIVAGFIGPSLASLSREWVPDALFAGAYICVATAVALTLLLLRFIRIAAPPVTSDDVPARPLAVVAMQPAYLIAALCALIGYGGMNLIMTATPLAMGSHAYPFADTALVIQWHVVAMFAPSFVTGHLIERFGVTRIIAVGALLLLGCIGINATGTSVAHFWTALVTLGLGWNFMFIGATAMLTDTYRPTERARAQGLNDLLLYSTLTMTSLGAGIAHAKLGWLGLNALVIAPAVLALGLVLWVGVGGRLRPAAAS